MGSNVDGQLAVGDTANRYSPVAMNTSALGDARVTAVSIADCDTVLVAGGRLFSVGSNTCSEGALGTGNLLNFNTLVAMNASGLGEAPVQAIAASRWHSLILAGDVVYVVGNNGNGQLGTGDTNNTYVPIPMLTPWGAASVTAIAASKSGAHTLVVAGGWMYGSGWNGQGQLGCGNYFDQHTPAPMAVGDTKGATVTAIAGGGYHTALVAGGQMFCTGSNGRGQLGIGNPSANVPTAVNASAMGNATVTAVAAGMDCSFLIADGVVYFTGNFSGFWIYQPEAVDASAWGGAAVTAIAVGNYHALLMTGGNVYVIGSNFAGQLGTGDTVFRTSPTLLNTNVLGAAVVTGIAAGGDSSMVLVDIPTPSPSPSPSLPHTASPSPSPSSPSPSPSTSPSPPLKNYVLVTGLNQYGQLGVGDAADRHSPVAMNTSALGDARVTAVSPSYYHTALIAGGKLFGTGVNVESLARGLVNIVGYSNTTVAMDSTAWGAAPVQAVSAGDYESGVLAGSEAYIACCYGTFSAMVSVAWGGALVTAIASSQGGSHTIVIAGSWAYGSGWNGEGQLGFGNNQDQGSPVPMKQGDMPGAVVTAIAAGGYHTVLIAGGKMFCTGLNRYGQLGIGASGDRNVPTAVNTSAMDNTTVAAVAAGRYFSLLIADGAVYLTGQLYTTPYPTQPQLIDASVWGGAAVTAIAVGHYHAVLMAGGNVYVFGQNDSGQLGTGDTIDRPFPIFLNTSVFGAGVVTDIAAGGKSTMLLIDPC
eukprot:EG_transcript_779